MGIESECLIDNWHQGPFYTRLIDSVDEKTGNEFLTICRIHPYVTTDVRSNFDENAIVVREQHFTEACHG